MMDNTEMMALIELLATDFGPAPEYRSDMSVEECVRGFTFWTVQMIKVMIRELDGEERDAALAKLTGNGSLNNIFEIWNMVKEDGEE